VALGAVGGVVAGLAVAGCGGERAPVDRLVIATGSTGGVYHALGTALGAAARARWGVPVRVLTTGADVDNLNLLASGAAQVGFSTVDTAALALAGAAPFRARLPVAALAGLYDDYMQVVVRADTPVTALGELAGYRLSTGSPGSGTEIIAGRLLAAAGVPAGALRTERLGVDAAADAVQANRLDGFFFSGGVPTPAVSRLAEQRLPAIRLIALDGWLPPLQRRYGEVYQKATVPHSAYGLSPVSTFGIHNVLAVNRHLPDGVARGLTELLFAARPRLVAAHPDARALDPRSALDTYPAPLHPGAAAWYRADKPY
jgi:TRAP transporter TAXI family solute receptor